MNRSPTTLYGRFPFARFGLVAAPLLITLGAASYVLATTNSASATLAGETASAIAGLALVIFLTLSVMFAVRLRKPVLTITTADVHRIDVILRWENVAGVDIQRYLGRQYVALNLRDSDAFLKTLPAYAAVWWARQLKGTRNYVLLPAVRGLSVQDLYDLVRAYWMEGAGDRRGSAAVPSAAYVSLAPMEGAGDRRGSAAVPSAAYVSLAPEETAAIFAGMAVGSFLSFRWMSLIDCIRASGVACALANAIAAVAVGTAIYLIALLVLRRVKRARPGFDLLQMLSVPEVVIGGADTTLSDLRGRRSVRREPYVTRLQKSPWRFILFCALIGGVGLLTSFGLLFFSAYVLEPGTNASKMSAVFTQFRAGIGLVAVLLLVDAALALVAIVNLKILGRGAIPPGRPGCAPNEGSGRG